MPNYAGKSIAFLPALRGLLDEMLDVLLDVFLMSVEAFRTFFYRSHRRNTSRTQRSIPPFHALQLARATAFRRVVLDRSRAESENRADLHRS